MISMEMKFSDGQSNFLRVFNFAILGYSRKLDAHEKLVFYSTMRLSYMYSAAEC